MRSKLAFAALAACSMSGAASAASFVNGGFESGPATGSFATVAGGDGTSIPGWTVTGNGVDYIRGYWQADTGVASVDLNGNGQGGLQQTFDTVLGQLYNVTFALAGNPDGAPAVKTVRVSSGGPLFQDYSFNSTGATHDNMGWLTFSYSFTATDTSTTLSFASQDASSYGAALDSVSVTAVPEPASWGLMILGFGVVGSVARRKKAVAPAIA